MNNKARKMVFAWARSARAHGGEVRVVVADPTDREAIAEWVASARQEIAAKRGKGMVH